MAKDARDMATLVCTVCGQENYHTERNTNNTQNRLELMKYCNNKGCMKRTLHKEKK